MYCYTRIIHVTNIEHYMIPGAVHMFSCDAISAALGLGKSQAVLKP